MPCRGVIDRRETQSNGWFPTSEVRDESEHGEHRCRNRISVRLPRGNSTTPRRLLLPGKKRQHQAGLDRRERREGADRIVQTIPETNEIQLWKFAKIGDFYNIVNVKTGKALNVANGSKEAGSGVIQWDAKDNDSENQQWSLGKRGNQYVIKARHSGMALDVIVAKTAPLNPWGRGAPLVQIPLKDGKNIHFELASRRAPLAPAKNENPGGSSMRATNSPRVVQVANFAVGEISKKEKAVLVKVLQAASGLAAGEHFELTLDVQTNDGIRTAYAEVFSSLDEKMELGGWEWGSDARRGKGR
ncbi:MAG: RICIN domain-containing protein [Gemmataceae bacterium]